ncbi:MAG: hypothetical protein Q9227_009470 [Pyrenula ochraceoflavens]
MSAKKPKHPRRNNHSSGHHQLHHHNPSLSHITQPSDYESDTPYFSENPLVPLAAPPPPRSNEELNISVLQRHFPAVQSILSIAPYVVVYVFNSSSTSWEKSGIEGSMFVSQLDAYPHLGNDRYSVFVLNRRGLDNFEAELHQEGDVEITEEYVILKTKSPEDPDTEKIIGLWIFSEPPPSSTSETRTINAQLIKQCAVQAGLSRQKAEQNLQTWQSQNGYQEAQQEAQISNPYSPQSGHQINVHDLFAQHRHPGQQNPWISPDFQTPNRPPQLHQQSQFRPLQTYHQLPPESGAERAPYQANQSRVRQAQTEPHPLPQQHTQPSTHQMFPQQYQAQSQQDILGDLFRRAGLG